MPEASTRLSRAIAWLARRFGVAGTVAGLILISIRLLFGRK